MQTVVRSIADLQTIEISANLSEIDVVLLHGYAMQPDDLAPFAHSLGIPARFFLPQGALPAEPKGHCWWQIDVAQRERQTAQRARDLALEHPAGLSIASRKLGEFCRTICAETSGRRLIVCGFSQGGMLACDAVLQRLVTPSGLALFSSSRIALERWTPHRARLLGLPVLITHGSSDPDLSFTAGEALRDFHVSAGANVTWTPFDGGHEIPLVAWRALRQFLKRQLSSGTCPIGTIGQ